jgi:hypothetical protein
MITVSEAKLGGPLKVLLSSHTTADMTAMTAGGLIVFYPEWTLNRVAVMNHAAVHRLQGQAMGTMTKSYFHIELTTRFLGTLCGERCPTLWRRSADHGSQSLQLCWDERFSVMRMMDRWHSEWCLSEECGNPLCDSHTANNRCSTRLPPDPMPGDLFGVRIQEALIQHSGPVSVRCVQSNCRC